MIQLGLLLAGFGAWTALAADPPAGAGDWRQGPLKDLNGDFSWAPPASREAWEKRAAQVRLQVKVAMGIHPLPEKTPLKAIVHGRRELEGYTVEKVILEAMPGFYVTGSLYRPTGLSGPFPAMLTPHGHWAGGRFLHETDGETARQMASGGEVLEAAARSPLQAGCVGLVRMGCVVFHYDMIGYADSVQLSLYLGHGFKTARPDMESPEGWGFYTAQAEGRLQSIMGLQTWSSIRALDFVSSLPDVDAARIGVTGGSGGGTQTFILAAVDPRPAVIFPAVMVSTAMQGGCTCENASLLRTGTGNVELAALFAPKPAGFTTADDWTREFSKKGYPELQAHWKLMGAPENTFLLNRTEFPHNYNLPSRLALYQWIARHLKTPRPAPAAEAPFTLLSKADLTVWDEAHPAPAAADPAYEKRLLQQWDADSTARIKSEPAVLDEVLPVLSGRSWEEAARGPFEWKPAEGRSTENGVQKIAGVLTASHPSEQVKCTFYYPENYTGQVLVMLVPGENPDNSPATADQVKTALAAGTAVAFPELFSAPGHAPGKIRRVEGDRNFLGYTAGYNTPELCRRAHDLMTLLAWMRQHDRKAGTIRIDSAAPLVPETALALALAPAGTVQEARLAADNFEFTQLTDAFDARLVPGMVKYGGMKALLERVKARTKLVKE